jgi:hypothetical protein
VRDAAQHRWPEILRQLNIAVPSTPKQHGPCPACGGTDRFRFDDQEGKGTWFCNQCSPKAGDGFALVQNVKRVTFPDATQMVAGCLGLSPTSESGKKIVKTYDYTDEAGSLIFQVVRFEPKDFRQRRPDGHGGWIWNLKDIEPVLYRLCNVMPASTVLIVEGEKDVDTAYRLGLPDGWGATCNAMGAGKWRQSYAEALLGTHAVILPDADEPGEKHGEQIAQSLLEKAASVRRLTLPHGFKDLSAWADRRTTADFHALLKEALPWTTRPTPQTEAMKQHVAESYQSSHGNEVAIQESTLDSYPTVIPLDEVVLPEFPIDAFPDPLRSMSRAVAASTETPIELAAMLGLSAVATCTQRVFEVAADASYSESLNLWTVSALESGNRKTAVFTAMTAPLLMKEREWCEHAKGAIAQAESERETMEARIKALRTKAANSADSADIAYTQTEINQLHAAMPPLPTVPRLWAQDITPEKLGALMADNNERLAIHSDEGGLFDILGGRYSNGVPNLDTFLQAHAGATVRVDRGSRPPVVMYRPALTIGLSPQPGVLRGLTAKAGFRDRGLLARFLYTLPASHLGYRSLRTEPVPATVQKAYQAMLFALLSFEPARDAAGETIPFVIRLSPDASSEWREFAERVEVNLRPHGLYEHIKDWAGKLPGAALRVAGNFHCVVHNGQQPWATEISLDAMRGAVTVLTVLSQHALAVFGLMGADPAIEGARKVWRWIERERHTVITARQCFDAVRGTYQTMAEVNPLLSVLVERGYLIEQERQPQGPGRPSRHYLVNPRLTEGWTL